TATASTPGESQFGFNVIYSSGDATALSQAPYSTAGSYAHNSGDEIISSAGAMSSSAVFTATYIANISGNEPAGTYTASITYTATSNF
ncbi:MAG TPA: hypothetical protein VJB67_03645, partial [Patescibacteria group bacterium]|nr:hypothetical protein [Patescibacteria group bacterium]